MTGPRHLLEITDLDADEVRQVLDLAAQPPEALGRPLAGGGAALLFQKPSTRTRHSTEMAVVQLGGHPLYTRGDEVGFDVRESVEDVTRILQGYHRLLAARVFEHGLLVRMAAVAEVPVVNLLSDRAHPLQAVADALTMEQALGRPLAGAVVAWVGDYNNVARSLVEICVLLGADVRLASPPGYGPDEVERERLTLLGGGTVAVTDRPAEAVAGAAAVHADTWVSMGQEHAHNKLAAMAPFQVDERLMAAARPDARFLHCLPAHVGEEVSAAVFEGPQSVVFDEAENRIHAQKSILLWCFGLLP